MDYRWRCSDSEGHDVAGAPGAEARFADQAEAEEWLAASWPDLRAAGVESVTLLDGEVEVYGPMSLNPAS